MALEHALLVSLREEPAAGLDLARRFEKSIGNFWQASHQQIYRVLGRMEGDGWIASAEVAQSGSPAKRVYSVTDLGAAALADWLGEPTPIHALRSDLAVKLRGASFGDVTAVLATVRDHIADHETRLAHYEHLAKRDYPEPESLTGRELDEYLVLRGGILTETTWVAWLTEYLDRRSNDLARTAPPKETS